MEKGRKTNKILTILLIIGTVTVFFPLYMAVHRTFRVESMYILLSTVEMRKRQNLF